MGMRLGGGVSWRWAVLVMVAAGAGCAVPDSPCRSDQDCESGVHHCDVAAGVCRTGAPAAVSSSSAAGQTSSSGPVVSSSSMDPGSMGSSSAGVTSSSTAGESSSGDGLDAGVVDAADAAGSIPLERLCESIMDPFLDEAIIGDDFAWALGCGILTREQIALTTQGPPATRAAFSCGPYGAMKAGLEKLGASVDAGRITYDPQGAAACVQQGREFFGRVSGGFAHRDIALMAVIRRQGGDRFPQVEGACATFIQGTVPLGGACSNDSECSTTSGPAACRNKTGANCQGECVLLPDPLPCGAAGFSFTCPFGFMCATVDAGEQVCVRQRQLGETCSQETGDCSAGLFCVDGTCHVPGGEGTACLEDSLFSCGTELYCQGGEDGGRCRQPLSTGTTCDPDGGPQCALCDQCKEGDGGFACSPRFVVNAACSNSVPCPYPYTCSVGHCQAPVGTGETCVPVGTDDTLRGNCLDRTNACLVTPEGRRCVARSAIGQPCEGELGVSSAVQGSCQRTCDIRDGEECTLSNGHFPYAERTAVCARSAGSVRNGTCVGPALVGEACGNRFDLSPYCVTSSGIPAVCTQSAQGLQGTCVHAKLANTGELCATADGCVAGLYCSLGDGGVAEDGGTAVGTCQAAGALDAPCGDEAPWRMRCQEGKCQTVVDEDAGVTSQRCSNSHKGRGEACLDLEECGDFMQCALVGADAGVCADRSGPDGPCRETRDCDPDDPHALQCFEGTCVSSLCASQHTGGCVDLSVSLDQDLPTILPYILMLGATVVVRRKRK